MSDVDADTKTEIEKIWQQRRRDKVTAKQDADDRHLTVMGTLTGIKSELQTMNGRLDSHDLDLVRIATREEERLRVAKQTGDFVGPSGLSGQLDNAKMVAASAGGSGTAFLVAWGVGKAVGWW